ncbi:MAG: hypothetical protein JKY17_03720 [Magnetovibrio sp.]|nr:hypothetical protein [Magnetovibrio sp.]
MTMKHDLEATPESVQKHIKLLQSRSVVGLNDMEKKILKARIDNLKTALKILQAETQEPGHA